MGPRLITDYELIESAVLYIEKNFKRQPSLKEISEAAGLSEHHFQRLFRRWAGISPKRFLQFVTAAFAKELLKGRTNLADVAYESGLSGTSRLHDLLVNVEAATPGEFRGDGEGLSIRYGLHPCPFGECFIAVTDRGICSLEFIRKDGLENAVTDLRSRWRKASISRDQKETGKYIDRIFSLADGQRIPVYVKGTNFQIKVWEALLKVPPGAVISYEDLAVGIGKPKAVRAVANAVASNPIAYLIPCHRVIRKAGAIGGYHWGTEKKAAILLWESSSRYPLH